MLSVWLSTLHFKIIGTQIYRIYRIFKRVPGMLSVWLITLFFMIIFWDADLQDLQDFLKGALNRGFD